MVYMTQNNLSTAKKRRHTQAATVLTVLFCALILTAQQRPAPHGDGQSAGMAVPVPVALPALIDSSVGIEQPQAASEPGLLDLAIEFIEPFEGRRYRAYRDSRGHLTIGVGYNLDRDGAARDMNKLLRGISYRSVRRGVTLLNDTQIDVLLRHDAQRAIDTARRQITGFDTLPVDAQLIVVDMTFNTGSLYKWRKFRSALARRDYTAAGDAMHRSLWRRQTGQRAKRLIERMYELAQG